MKTSIILPILVSFAVRVLADVPPACLLNAVNTQEDPSNLSAVCGNEANDVQKAIASLCSGNVVSVAQSAFISTCSVAGSSVAPYTATSNSSATTTKNSSATSAGTFIYTTAVYNSDCSCTTTIVATATSGAVVSTGLATATGANGASSTGGSSASGNAAADTKQVGSFAAAVIAIAGVVAVL